ncbi:hypothetical protein [Virgibacillus siamensis]|uniref:hypothetical protein n=1 Tax=Virgibacillus siamensis TaxID=480071 RepID=UPI0009857F78|nr:hypothetical protein [Virgibacillus siamensis]
MKKYLFLLMLGSLLLAACSESGGFNADTAAKDSKERMNEFLSLYKYEEPVSSLKSEDIKKLINENMKEYFSDNYMQKIEYALENRKTEDIDSEYLFFLINSSTNNKAVFNSNFSITDYQVNEEKETVLLRLDANEMNVGESMLKIEMALEEGKWKINRVG